MATLEYIKWLNAGNEEYRGSDFTIIKTVNPLKFTFFHDGKSYDITEREFEAYKAAIKAGKDIEPDKAGGGPHKTSTTYNEVVQLPPVDVVDTKPTSGAAGNNAKILLLVVGVAAALILFNK